jgi:uncharacterized membrane protein YhhN
MTSSAWLCLVIAGGFAIGDWYAVVTKRARVEYWCKPLTIVFLMGVAASIDVSDSSAQHWFVAALGLSLIGDIFLMLPRDLFVPGLVAFLLAHIAYIAGMWAGGVSGLVFVLGLAIVSVAALVIGGRIIAAVRRGPNREMAGPVGAYMVVISLMVASAIGTQTSLAIAGAALFFASDALIAWDRFVTPRPWHGLGIIVTYHLAQAGLTLSLIA